MCHIGHLGVTRVTKLIPFVICDWESCGKYDRYHICRHLIASVARQHTGILLNEFVPHPLARPWGGVTRGNKNNLNDLLIGRMALLLITV